jgi:hypothetical protein
MLSMPGSSSTTLKHRTPVAGYYLCGAGMHPGGGVMGAAGHNAAQAVLADASVASPAQRAGRRRGSPAIIDRIMDTEPGRRVGYRLARNRAFRPLAKLAARSGRESRKR